VHAHLDKADVLGVLAEALAADVDAVLADQTVVVAAHAAAGEKGQRKQGHGVRELTKVSCVHSLLHIPCTQFSISCQE